jgi:hypothetical protein
MINAQHRAILESLSHLGHPERIGADLVRLILVIRALDRLRARFGRFADRFRPGGG